MTVGPKLSHPSSVLCTHSIPSEAGFMHLLAGAMRNSYIILPTDLRCCALVALEKLSQSVSVLVHVTAKHPDEWLLCHGHLMPLMIPTLSQQEE